MSDYEPPAAWEGPFDEFNHRGERTGHTYVRCTGCGIEVLTGDERHATHRPACSEP